MNLTYRHDKRSVSSRRAPFLVAGIFVIGVIVLTVSPLRAPVSRGMHFFASGVWQGGDRTLGAIKNFLGGFVSKETLVEENRSLREEVSRMQVQVLDRNLLEEKVRDLEERLGRTNVDDRIVAHVLAGSGRSPYDLLVIDAGEDLGVALGNRVVYAGAGVAGEIIEVYGSSAKVKLYSSPGVQLPVLVVGTTTIPTIATGRGMGNFEVRVPQGSVVTPGEIVITPENLIVGTVGAVIENETMPFVRVLFTSPFNIAEMRTVEIIRNFKN